MALMIAVIPLSRYLMSVSQFILAGFFLFEGAKTSQAWQTHSHLFSKLKSVSLAIGSNFRRKFKIFFSNTPALIFSSIYLLHLVGLFFTNDDFGYAIKDLRTKLPILILPLVMGTSPAFNKRDFQKLMLIFTGAVMLGTLAGVYTHLTQDITDMRNVSRFISHIRFSLNICLAIMTMIYFSGQRSTYSKRKRIAFLTVGLWLLIFLFFMESVSGLVILASIFMFLLLVFLLGIKNIYYRTILVSIFFLFPFSVGIYLHNIYREYTNVEPVDISKLEKTTAQGNYYTHDTVSFLVENGTYSGLFICEKELRTAWNARSPLKYDQKDTRDQHVKYTLIRFLNSKGLRKDAAGVQALTDEEVRYIEDGVANVHYLEKFSIKSRMYQTLMGFMVYQNNGDPNANSLMQRMEYWKTSIALIKENPIHGVGTGDMNVAFARMYEKTKSPLQQIFRRRSHNQYLSILVAFGFVGFAWFLVALFYPAIRRKGLFDYFFIVFLLISLISMLTEDTIETQAGVTFFTYFYCLFIFARKPREFELITQVTNTPESPQ